MIKYKKMHKIDLMSSYEKEINNGKKLGIDIDFEDIYAKISKKIK